MKLVEKIFFNDSGGGSVGGPKIQNEKVESDAKKRKIKEIMMFK